MYGLGIRPWERYSRVARASIGRHLDSESADRRPGRALDLGCGRGDHSAELSARGWDVVGVDLVPRAIKAATAREIPRTRFLVGDVTRLPDLGLGTFDLFLDVGCFQGLDQAQRMAMGAGVTALAEQDATILMLAFHPTTLRRITEGVTQAEVEAAFPAWHLIGAEPAETKGLGWPLNRSRPTWYRFAR